MSMALFLPSRISRYYTFSMLDLRNIRKSFGDFHALQDVSLEVKPGEIHGLLGENGAGKSTLMRIAGGFLRPDGGAVFLAGQDMSQGPLRPGFGGVLGMVGVYCACAVEKHARQVAASRASRIERMAWAPGGGAGDPTPAHARCKPRRSTARRSRCFNQCSGCPRRCH